MLKTVVHQCKQILTIPSFSVTQKLQKFSLSKKKMKLLKSSFKGESKAYRAYRSKDITVFMTLTDDLYA